MTVYAPQEGCPVAERDALKRQFEYMIMQVDNSTTLIMAGDFNAQVWLWRAQQGG